MEQKQSSTSKEKIWKTTLIEFGEEGLDLRIFLFLNLSSIYSSKRNYVIIYTTSEPYNTVIFPTHFSPNLAPFQIGRELLGSKSTYWFPIENIIRESPHSIIDLI